MKSLNLWLTFLDGYVNICVFFTWKREWIQGANMLYLIDEFKCKVQLDFAGKEF